MPSARRFPPPWSVDEQEACFIVRDGNGQALAYVYRRGDQRPSSNDVREHNGSDACLGEPHRVLLYG